jgi:hypothetical protein
MSDLNLHASSEILNEFEWQLCRRPGRLNSFNYVLNINTFSIFIAFSTRIPLIDEVFLELKSKFFRIILRAKLIHVEKLTGFM